jgi:ABC-type transport system involved in multi-copper enzyme maturation permease subunit
MCAVEANAEAPVRSTSSQPPGKWRRTFSQVWSNPIVLKELRGRMRGWRAVVVLTVYLAVLSCFTGAMYFTVAQSAQSMGGATVSHRMGQTLFYSTYVLLLTLVVLLSPAFTAGAISGERERKTLDLLITTLLPTHSLVLGKLISALAYIVLLIVAALPILSLGLTFGGIILSEVFIGTLLLLVTAMLAGSIGILVSSIMRSSIASTVITYAVILLTSLGLPIVIFVMLSLFGFAFDPLLDDLSWIVQAILLYAAGFLISTNPFATAIAAKLIEQQENTLFYFTVQVFDTNGTAYTLPLVSPWIVYVLLAIALSALLILISILTLQRKRG